MLLYHPATFIIKSDSTNDTLRIKIKASAETEDRDGETILKSAFSDNSMRSNFLKSGYYDYNHLTTIIDKMCSSANGPDLVELQKSKTKAIIGYPEKSDKGLYIHQDGVFSEGYLFPKNEYVQEIRKGLESGWQGWGASITALADPQDIDGKTIKRLQLKAIAIQPLQESINQETFVSIAKSEITPLRDIFKANTHLQTETDNNALLTAMGSDQKLCLIMKYLIQKPDFQEMIAQELSIDLDNALKNQTMPVLIADIKRILKDKYLFDDSMVSGIIGDIKLGYI
jgi:hypothetical protein